MMGNAAILSVAWLASAFIAEATLQAVGTTYYVAIDGQDGNDGKSLKTPFRRIQKAAEVMQPGDMVLIRGGEYREKIVPARGGTSEQVRITYRNYGDEKPVIKGSERVTTWSDEGGGVWKADLPRTFFNSSPYNPFATKAGGHCIINPGNKWSIGMVFLNGASLGERLSLAEVQNTPRTWWATDENGTTVVHARFDADPNAGVAEVSVRNSCFHPGDKVLNFISIVGLTMKQASPNGSGPIYPQQGIITAYAGRGWIIEGCSVSDSPCAGIALATGPESWYNAKSATVNAKGSEPDFNASGFHRVRRNTIERCGQVGIVGMISGHSSVIEMNLVQDINTERKLGGAETAGIKLHWAIDTVIKNNIIRRVFSGKEAGQNFGLWLDFACQGTRVTGNVIYDIVDPPKSTPKCFPIYLEANVGPIVVDNNIIIKHPDGPWNNELGSLYSIVAHNLMLEARIQQFNDPTRNVPYYQPNSLKFIATLDAKSASDKNKFRYVNKNNIYVGPYSDQDGATITGGNVKYDGTAQQKMAFTRTDTAAGVDITFDMTGMSPLPRCDLVTSQQLGEFPLVKQRVTDGDGKPYDMDTDIMGRSRQKSPIPGPFALLAHGKNVFAFTAGSTASSFIAPNGKQSP